MNTKYKTTIICTFTDKNDSFDGAYDLEKNLTEMLQKFCSHFKQLTVEKVDIDIVNGNMSE